MTIEGRARAAKNDHDRAIEIAHLNAALRRAKKFPKLRDLITAEPKRGKPKSWQQQLANWAQFLGSTGKKR